jgi:hypothetical protein
MLKLVAKIVWETFQWVGLIGGVLGLLAGLLLIFNSPLFFRIGERMNVWISTRKATDTLDAPITIERAVYRAHRLVGALILAGALFTLYVVLFRFKGPELVWAMAQFFRLIIASWVAESLRIFLIVANGAAAAFAIVMLIRPSALKHVEAWANRRYSGSEGLQAWETPRPAVDNVVQANPRLTGLLLTLAGAFVSLVLGYSRLLAP